jgi:hypothetical protein
MAALCLWYHSRYVEKKLLEAEKDELKAQITSRDEIDRQIETRVMTMMDRLRELEAENLALKFEKGRQTATKDEKSASEKGSFFLTSSNP